MVGWPAVCGSIGFLLLSSLTIAYARKGYVGGVLVILLLGRVRFGVFWVSLDFVSGLVWLASRTCC